MNSPAMPRKCRCGMPGRLGPSTPSRSGAQMPGLRRRRRASRTPTSSQLRRSACGLRPLLHPKKARSSRSSVFSSTQRSRYLLPRSQHVSDRKEQAWHAAPCSLSPVPGPPAASPRGRFSRNTIAVSLNGTPQLYMVYDGANSYLDFISQTNTPMHRDSCTPTEHMIRLRGSISLVGVITIRQTAAGSAKTRWDSRLETVIYTDIHLTNQQILLTPVEKLSRF
jgi:hypothetical protein